MIQIQKSMREAKQAMLRTFMETTIARVAKAVFAERGYQQATLEEIAQRAGMSTVVIFMALGALLLLPVKEVPQR